MRTAALWIGQITCAMVAGLVLGGNVIVAAETSAKDKIDFNSQIRPLLSSHCFHCHGPDEKSRKAKLRLDLRDEAIRERDEVFPIKPGDLKNSEMIRRITLSKDSDDIMPPIETDNPLKPAEIELLKKWVQQGAPYSEHWAFVKPERPVVPKTKSAWSKNTIDHFILAKLQENKLKPSQMADRYALIRRVSLDLIGLPPTPAETEAFVKNKSPNAYEIVVDRLLASPAYGEKWARMWMDIARYADSYGLGQDSLRQNNPWPYRDWVINAFNRNMPFDQFTFEQLAGDLLANPTEEQLVATAFHRNTMTNVEGGTDDEEWRVAAVKDRANVTAQAWMGLTMGCAQCHSHKFDPISQKEYYQFYGIFNQTEDNDQADERPTMPLLSPEQRRQKSKLEAEIAELERKVGSNAAAITEELTTWQKTHEPAQIWKVVEPQVSSAKKGEFKLLEDKSVLAVGEIAGRDTYTTKFTSPKVVTALRLELLPDGSLPAHGPGRNQAGSMVLSELSMTVKSDEKTRQTRFVRIDIPGRERILSLAEVQAFTGDENVAAKGKATQSSVDFSGEAPRAIDGNANGNYDINSTTHTKTEDNPWWEVDLGVERALDSIKIWNRTDGDVGSRLSNFQVTALNSERKIVWSTRVSAAPRPSVALRMDQATVALKRATATYSQKDFNVSRLLSEPVKQRGWAIDGGQGKPQTAVFEFAAPLPEGEVTLKLVQNYGDSHTIGRFRLALTDAASPVLALPAEIESVLTIVPEKRSEAQRAEVVKWFEPYSGVAGEVRGQIEARKNEIAALNPPRLPIMKELATKDRRVTHLLNKGNFLDPGDLLPAGIPSAFNPLPIEAPTNRLGVAMWLMSPDNPLTARVQANRFWAQLFGIGLVETEEDFGTQGTMPSHPELLDWLAVEFREGGWDVKQLLKLIVMSATYQQSSRVTSEMLGKDPRNRFLAHFPRRRLEAEMVRDQALALSGLLSHKIGGPSVYPPQPDGLWRVSFDGTRNYPTSKGEDRYRRGLYTIWRRTVPYPSMTTFDAPSRETCTFRRLPTNTPLQAYVTMNDSVYVEAAQALGRRLVREGGTTAEARIEYGLRLVLGRPPTKAEMASLKELYKSELKHYTGKEKDAVKLATNPLGALPEGLNAAEAAAWTVVANVLLNLDGVLVKS